MLDIKFIREHSEEVKENIKMKFQDEKLKLVDEVLSLDEQWRKEKFNSDLIRKERNQISEAINQAKKKKDEKKAKELIIKAKDIPEKIKKIEEKTEELENKIRVLLMRIPNIISKNVPLGKSDKENKVVKIVGKPSKMNFEIKSHGELIEQLQLGDFESSSRVSGTGFYYIEGEIALLNQALLNYARDIMVKK